MFISQNCFVKIEFGDISPLLTLMSTFKCPPQVSGKIYVALRALEQKVDALWPHSNWKWASVLHIFEGYYIASSSLTLWHLGAFIIWPEVIHIGTTLASQGPQSSLHNFRHVCPKWHMCGNFLYGSQLIFKATLRCISIGRHANRDNKNKGGFSCRQIDISSR